MYIFIIARLLIAQEGGESLDTKNGCNVDVPEVDEKDSSSSGEVLEKGTEVELHSHSINGPSVEERASENDELVSSPNPTSFVFIFFVLH